MSTVRKDERISSDHHEKKYPNALSKWLKVRGSKVQRAASQTGIPLRTMWEYVAERRPIDPERLNQLAAYFQCQPEQMLSKVPSLWFVPYQRNPLFTGREEILTHLYESLRRKSSIVAVTQAQAYALSGLGGIGKTQTVLEFLYRYCDEYDAIFWLKADTRESLLSDFLHIAGLLKLPERDSTDHEMTIAAIHQWMREQSGWLLILDNADDLRLASEFIPSGYRGHVLLTTRAQAMGRLAYRLDIDEMNLETGALFLLRRAGLIGHEEGLYSISEHERQLAMNLVRELGGLPLALDQAGAYMEETPCSVAEYLELYQHQRLALLKRRGGILNDHPEPVATTWSISFKKVEHLHPTAADLLRACAFFDPDGIPEELIIHGAADLGPHLSSAASNPLVLYEAIGALSTYSLIRRHFETKMLSLHRLVQVVQRESMGDEEQRLWASRSVCAVLRSFPARIEVGTWLVCQRLLSQAQACATLIEQWDLTIPEAAQLLNQTAYYLRERARYTEAELLYQKALSIRERQKGPDHLDIAQVSYNLARLYFDQGRHADAADYYLRALTIRESVLGPIHPDVARCLNSLALLYWSWGVQYEEAEQLYLRALPIFEETLGPEHPQTAHCWNNLALLQVTQQKYAEAELIHCRVLKIRETVLPREHLDTAQTLQNLACLYLEQRATSRYAEAEILCLRSLEIREHVLGLDHPQVARSLNNLALLYEAQERYEEAVPLYQRALLIREKALGPENPKTVVTRQAYTDILGKIQGEQKGS